MTYYKHISSKNEGCYPSLDHYYVNPLDTTLIAVISGKCERLLPLFNGNPACGKHSISKNTAFYTSESLGYSADGSSKELLEKVPYYYSDNSRLEVNYIGKVLEEKEVECVLYKVDKDELYYIDSDNQLQVIVDLVNREFVGENSHHDEL
ncbi:MAG: hypothetical protein K0T99_00060 [Alphaproteobacteria bacterium]|nr:hypothetical protein [Alphaproteobacteria bacterium]